MKRFGMFLVLMATACAESDGATLPKLEYSAWSESTAAVAL